MNSNTIYVANDFRDLKIERISEEDIQNEKFYDIFRRACCIANRAMNECNYTASYNVDAVMDNDEFVDALRKYVTGDLLMIDDNEPHNDNARPELSTLLDIINGQDTPMYRSILDIPDLSKRRYPDTEVWSTIFWDALEIQMDIYQINHDKKVDDIFKMPVADVANKIVTIMNLVNTTANHIVDTLRIAGVKWIPNDAFLETLYSEIVTIKAPTEDSIKSIMTNVHAIDTISQYLTFTGYMVEALMNMYNDDLDYAGALFTRRYPNSDFTYTVMDYFINVIYDHRYEGGLKLLCTN